MTRAGAKPSRDKMMVEQDTRKETRRQRETTERGGSRRGTDLPGEKGEGQRETKGCKDGTLMK